MRQRSHWEEFFDGHAPQYLNNAFTKNTVAEIDFVLEELKLATGRKILDMGCGAGRHSVELARRGYVVTGVDFSAGMLAVAAKAAREASVTVEWIRADATEFKPAGLFDGAICLCEGAFSLLDLEDDPIEHDLAILRNLRAALETGGRLILTATNGLRHVRKYAQADVEAGRFDPTNMVETLTMEWATPDGKKDVLVRERGYVPTELAILLRWAGFDVQHLWGGTAAKWERRPVELDEFEVMVIARKS